MIARMDGAASAHEPVPVERVAAPALAATPVVAAQPAMLELASAIGNRAMARALTSAAPLPRGRGLVRDAPLIARRVQPAQARRLARRTVAELGVGCGSAISRSPDG